MTMNKKNNIIATVDKVDILIKPSLFIRTRVQPGSWNLEQ